MNIKTIEFIEKAKKVHGDRYNYDLVDYLNKLQIIIYKDRVAQKCKNEGIFSRSDYIKRAIRSICPTNMKLSVK